MAPLVLLLVAAAPRALPVPLRLVVKDPELAGRVESIRAHVSGAAGGWLFEGLSSSHAVPAGRYRLNLVELSLHGDAGSWRYVLGVLPGHSPAQAFEVKAGEAFELDPLEGSSLRILPASSPWLGRAGEPFSLLPEVRTRQGLLLISCVGPGEGPAALRQAQVILRDGRGRDRATTRTGFS